MPVPKKRFNIYGDETNVPVSDFMESDNAGVINTDTGGDVSPPEVQPPPIKESDLLDALPAVEGILETPTDVTKAFIQNISPDNVTSVLNKELSKTLGLDMGRIFKNTSRTLPANILMNRVLRRLPQTECERDLNSLLRMLKRLGLPYDIQFDINAATAALLAILFKLMCAGVNNAFGKIFGISSNGQLLANAGAGMIIAAAKNSYPNAVMDVASTSVAPLVKERVPDIATIAMGTLNGYKHNSRKQSFKDFVTNFKAALDALDPVWRQTVANTGGFPDILDLGRLTVDASPFHMSLDESIASEIVPVSTNITTTQTPNLDLKLTTGIRYIPDTICDMHRYYLNEKIKRL